MNKKLYFNLIFLIAGSFIVLSLATIVTANFIKDSRLLGKNETVGETTPIPTQAPKSTQASGTNKKPETINYQREIIITKPKVDHGEDMNKPVASPTPAPESTKTEKYKIEVINCTGAKNVAEDVRKLFEAAGFEVSAGNGPSDKPVKTEIIDRNDKNASVEIRQILKIGKVSKVIEANSIYDATIIIGEDYLP